ncbi:MAG TPA: outer membrane protein transport protein [Limnobacter sp.]|uniref:OmpP1/FadL family transporter n=1 Tax=Limnobacter sp. TaxID=2003368 RepID=UPI002ED7B163
MKISRVVSTVLKAQVLSLVLLAGPVSATNGYFSHGYGTKAKGRGGVSLSIADDAMAPANNPALLVDVGNRFDAGFDAFVPRRGAERTGGPLGQFDFSERSDRNLFIIPDFGFSKKITDRVTAGVAIYGNGGLNTDYQKGNTAACPTSLASGGRGNPLCGQGPAGVNLEQLVVAPTVAFRINANHAVGISPLLVYQRFYAEGLQLFGTFGYSADANRLTNQGTSSSHGQGYRVGYYGTYGPVNVGVSYSPRINMSKFNEYAGLFAGQGDFDIPTNKGLGVSWKVTPRLRVGADITKVEFSEVPAVGNSRAGAAPGCNCLGNSDGPGFGWSDVTTRKFGLEYRVTDNLTLRGGYNKGDNPVGPEDVTFNILAPGVVTKHYTAGFTYKLSSSAELSAHYMRAPNVRVTGPSALPVPGPVETIDMGQESVGMTLGLSY